MKGILCLLALLGALLLAACGPSISEEDLQATFANSVDATVRAEVVARSVTETVAQLSATPTATHTPTSTPSATPTPTPSGPIAAVLQAATCLSGPGDSYLLRAELEPGAILPLLFLDDDNDYLGVQPRAGAVACWLAFEHAEVLNAPDPLPAATMPPTPSPSPTPTPNVVWRGLWNIWVGPEPLTLYRMALSHTGLQISGSFDAGGGNIVSLEGTLSEDYQQARGVWVSSAGGSGVFYWERRLNPNQFVGNQDNGTAAWCGSRSGASLPSPCLGPQ